MAEEAQDNQPTEAEVKAANEAEEAKWQDDFPEEDLTVPYAPEESEEVEDETPQDTPAPVSDDDDDEEPEKETYEEPEPIVTTQDPGEFKPSDYSFKVTLASGKKVTVKTPEQAEEIGDDPDNFETPKQLMDFINKSQKMINGIDKDKEKWQQQKDTYQTQVEVEEERQKTVQSLSNEFEYLEGKGLLPQTPPQYRNADWQDPGVAKQEGVKEKIEILDYMVKENEARAKAGVKPLTSAIDAFNAWQAETNRTQQKIEKKTAGERRKAAGSRVAGVSPSRQNPYVPKGISVGNPNAFKRSAAIWDD